MPAAPADQITATPILPRFGAEISGVDISRPLDATTAQRLIDLQDEWGVTVYRNTGLDTESHIAFSRLFGHLELAPAIKSPDGQELPRRLPRELFLSSNIGPDGEINRNPSSRLYAKGDRLWHTDSSFMPVRSAYSLLLAHEVPPADGLTWFADTRSAYDDLPQETKERIEDLVVEHSLWWSRRAAGAEISEEEIDARTKARHKMVYTDPRTGRRALYVGAHARDVIGMEREEGRRLIAELNAWIARPEYVFSVAWQVGDMVIWNNLISQHRGGEFDIDNHRREMRRTTVREATPQDAGADPFSALFSEMPQLIKS